jgi:type IV secretory pathway VirB3-like protein
MAKEDGAAVGRSWLVYTALRLLVFVGVAGALAVVGLNGFLLLAVALVISAVVSGFVLRRQRAAAVAATLARREQRSADRAALRLDDPPL